MKRKLLIKGERVQDIGYRAFLLNLASDHGLIGFQARNVGRDGVEAIYEGGADSVRTFEADVRELAPEDAKVEEILFEDYDGPVRDIEKFRSQFMTFQLEKIIEVGLGMIQKQDETLTELRAFREESRRNQQLMIQKQDETLTELRVAGRNLETLLEDRLASLERDVLLIKEKLGIK
ncbi:MAG: acylphosphatase [Candidatus Korarchaeum sp.]|nr:acylphosphatase [Candidatus Korarchaeum sp.]